MKTTEKAYAKLNISLDIVAKRPDGYHDMRMVMQSVSLCDDVSVTLRHDGRISAETNLSYLPNDDRNIAVKTARTFFAKIHQPELGAQIVLNKRIPVCAGMGGGSSDGAAVLRALNRLTEKSLTCAQLEALVTGTGYLVDEITVELDRKRHAKRKARRHARRIAADRLVHIGTKLRKVFNEG